MRDTLIRFRNAKGGDMCLHSLVPASMSPPARIKMASLAQTVGFRFGFLRMAMLPSALRRHIELLRGFNATSHTRIREYRIEPEPLSMYSRPAREVFYGDDWSRFPGRRTVLWRGLEGLRLRK